MNPARKKKREEIEEERYDPDLLEFKRRMAEAGVVVHLPKPGARFSLPEPIDFGVSVSDIVIRNRGKEP
jgi:hypothetical protein